MVDSTILIHMCAFYTRLSVAWLPYPTELCFHSILHLNRFYYSGQIQNTSCYGVVGGQLQAYSIEP